MNVTVDKVIAKYIDFRKTKEAIESEAKAKVSDIKEQMAKLEAWLKEKADFTLSIRLILE